MNLENFFRTIIKKSHYSYGRIMKQNFSKKPPHTLLKMPALSPTMTQGNIGKWLKNIGDAVEPGDILVEIETDKAQMEFECQDEGYLAKIILESGEKDVKVGSPLAIIAENKDDVKAFEGDFELEKSNPREFSKEGAKKNENNEQRPEISKESKSETKAPKETEPFSQTPGRSGKEKPGRIIASPLAKNIARQQEIDLSPIKGSGPDGRIVRIDLEQAPLSLQHKSKNYADIPLSNVRRVIADRLLESKNTIPHYYLTSTIQMDSLISIRSKLNRDAKDFKISVNDFIIKAASRAMAKVPTVNSSWQNDSIRQYSDADISVAVATGSGLITPIIRAAQTKGLKDISQEIRALAQLAKQNKLKPEQYQGGSFTISNLGMYDIDSFTAIINPPQSCILAVGSTKPVYLPCPHNPPQPILRQVMKVTMSCDHRVVDGATGAQWLKVFKEYMEDPLTLLL